LEVSLLVQNWRRVLKRAWSIRLMMIAGLLSGLEAALPLLGGLYAIPPGILPAVSGLTVTAAFVTRLLAQKDMKDGT
jgi:hypothetical protein